MSDQTGTRKNDPDDGEIVPCPRCGESGIQRVRHYVHIRRPPVLWVECAACEKARREAKQRRWIEENITRIRQRKTVAGIEGPLQKRSFDGFEAKSEEQRGVLDSAKIFADGHGPIWLAFCGRTGTGKSHLALAIANHMIESGSRSICYVKVIGMMRRFRATFNSKNVGETEEEVASYYQHVDLLVLDEFGIRKELSEWEGMTLDDILNYRWEQEKRTIIISNMTPKQMFLAAGERIESRFAELGDIVDFTWDDYRKRGGAA